MFLLLAERTAFVGLVQVGVKRRACDRCGHRQRLSSKDFAGSGQEGRTGATRDKTAAAAAAWPPGASSVSSTTARNYLSDSRRAGRKVFFDFATLPDRATHAKGADSTGCPARFNGCGEFAFGARCWQGVLARNMKAQIAK